MMGDHTVLGLFLDLVPYYAVPIIFYGLGLFVCIMQAFRFYNAQHDSTFLWQLHTITNTGAALSGD